MKNTSIQFRRRTWLDWHGKQQAIPLEIQNIAGAFVDLQEERHTADYDNHAQWSLTDVQATLDLARFAFQQWRSIRADPMAGDFLLAMLVNRQSR